MKYASLTDLRNRALPESVGFADRIGVARFPALGRNRRMKP